MIVWRRITDPTHRLRTKYVTFDEKVQGAPLVERDEETGEILHQFDRSRLIQRGMPEYAEFESMMVAAGHSITDYPKIRVTPSYDPSSRLRNTTYATPLGDFIASVNSSSSNMLVRAARRLFS